MAVPDSALPVWTLRPNWRSGITERLAWLTDVIPADNGTEQTRALRLSPRREFEMTFNPWDEDRSYFDLWLHRLADDEFMAPLWHDKGALTANVAAGAVTIPLDNTNREFTVGGMCVLIGDGPHTFDAATITAMTDTELTVSAPLALSWLKGAAIYPLRRFRLSDESRLVALTRRVAEAVLAFESNQADDLASEGTWTGLEYEGLPVITSKPNYSERLDLAFMRMAETAESDHGLKYMASGTDRAFTTQLHTFRARGRPEQMALRQMLYRLRGRSQYAWLPTFNQDVRLARAVASGDSVLDIRKIGYAYTGGAISGRDRLLINGATPVQITGTGAALAAGEERLTLSGPVGADFAAGVSGSFLEPSRLDQDTVEIFHHSDSNGVADCKAAFRAILATRTAPAIIHYPIPATAKSDSNCGVKADDACLDLAEPPVFEGWYYMFEVDLVQGSPSANASQHLRYHPGVAGEETVYSYTDDPGEGPCGSYMLYPSEFGGVTGESQYTVMCDHPLGENWNLTLQYPSGSVPANSRARLLVRHWTESGYRTAPCTGGGDIGDDGSFDIQGLWPRTYEFAVV